MTERRPQTIETHRLKDLTPERLARSLNADIKTDRPALEGILSTLRRKGEERRLESVPLKEFGDACEANAGVGR